VPVEGVDAVADFCVNDEYVEIVGMIEFQRYRERHERKRFAYESAGVRVRWVYPDEVERLFASSSTVLRFKAERECAECGVETYDLVKTLCRTCYMRRWHTSAAARKCVQCGSAFRDAETQRFCSRSCYWKSMELDWPDCATLDRLLSQKPIFAVAADLGVRPSTLYLRRRRRRLRQRTPD